MRHRGGSRIFKFFAKLMAWKILEVKKKKNRKKKHPLWHNKKSLSPLLLRGEVAVNIYLGDDLSLSVYVQIELTLFLGYLQCIRSRCACLICPSTLFTGNSQFTIYSLLLSLLRPWERNCVIEMDRGIRQEKKARGSQHKEMMFKEMKTL